MTARIRDMLWLMGLLGLTRPASVLAQGSTSHQDSLKLAGCPKAIEYPCGAAPKVSPDRARFLLDALATLPEARYDSVLRAYLGESYGEHFNDWIVYIGKDTVKQALFVEGKFTKGNLIRGGQSVFAVVFSSSSLAITKTKPTGPPPTSPAELAAADIALISKRCTAEQVQCSLQVPTPVQSGGEEAPDTSSALELTRTTLQYTREPALTAFIKSITKNVVGDAGQTVAVADTMVRLGLVDVVRHEGPPAEGPQLLVGFRKLATPSNSLVRYTLRANQPGIRRDIPTAISITRTVENASRNRFGASLGLGVTGDAPDSTFIVSHDSAAVLAKSTSSPWKPNAWVLAHFYITRPQLPISSTSVSVIAGTNVGLDNLFRDLLVGISVDRVFGDVGVMSGFNFIERQSGFAQDSTGGKIRALGSRTYRKGKWFAGINFAL